MALRASFFAALFLLAACGDPSSPAPDAAAPVDAGLDARTSVDASPDPSDADAFDADAFDAGPSDAGPSDAGPSDAGPPVEGTISGSCGVIDTELFDPEPVLFENEITFHVRLTEADLVHFTEGARAVLAEGTVGGSSVYSEAIAFEVLARCEGADLLAGEPSIRYVDPNGKRTDLLVRIDGERVGVSVARAVHFPRESPYPLAEAERVLTNKLSDIHQSTANVDERDRWVKQILHVIAYAPMHAEMMRAAWATIADEIRGDTILIVTVTNGEDAFIYDNRL